MNFLGKAKRSRRRPNDDKSAEMSSLVEVKSKFDAEFRRFSVQKDVNANFSDFQSLIEKLHHLTGTIFLIFYTDPKDGDLLPINNDDNLRCALFNARPLIRILVQRKDEINESIKIRHKNTLFGILTSPSRSISISNPQNFRQVSAIIDVDIVPKTCRRVRLLKHGSDKPLGFYIRDGTSIRATTTTSGLETTPGIFVSRLVPGGLAESSGLLSVNDEIIEVNGIEVSGKTLDQVTDMMIANSSNLIITVKPENPRTNPHPSANAAAASAAAAAAVRRGSIGRSSQLSSSSRHSVITTCSDNDDKFDDQDEIKDHTFKMPHSDH